MFPCHCPRMCSVHPGVVCNCGHVGASHRRDRSSDLAVFTGTAEAPCRLCPCTNFTAKEYVRAG